MSATKIVDGLYQLAAGLVNVFLFETQDGLILVDTGYPNGAEKVLKGIRELGYQAQDVKQIVITHAHPDHIGCLADLKRATGATVAIHSADADIVRNGTGFRTMIPSPRLLFKIMHKLLMTNPPVLEGVPVDHELKHEEILPIGDGVQVLHTPGHSSGHIVLYWPSKKVLIAADACMTLFGLGVSVGYEDPPTAHESLNFISSLDFDIACFGHGKPILNQADEQFRMLWSPRVAV
jgi:glyoxylase-like metal-dependent hydrolase (beta-lactamase superfamily II)